MIEHIDKFYAVDFDRCLGNFEANIALMNEVTEELSIINGEMLQSAHDEIKASGMPFRILKYLKENDPSLDLDVLRNTYIERAQSYPGSLIEPGAGELLDFLKLGNHHFCIMTFGDEDWQTTKIVAAGLGEITKLVVPHERKSDKIVEWLDEKSGHFVIPGECFPDKKTRTAQEVILIDDKSNAFVGLPIGARGYLVHNEKSIYASTHENIPSTVRRVNCLEEIIRYES